MGYKPTFQPTGRPPTVAVNPLGTQIDTEWARIQAEKPREPEHHCALCSNNPFGKSAVRCPNEPKGATRG